MLSHYRLLQLELDLTWERRQLVNDLRAERRADFCRRRRLPNIFESARARLIGNHRISRQESVRLCDALFSCRRTAVER
jgi:hypothetical protein